MATSRRFVQITDKEINKIKITCVKILKQLFASGSVIMPIERVKVHVNDCPWITPNFKELIRHRQNAFISGGVRPLSQASKFNQSRTEDSAEKILHF